MLGFAHQVSLEVQGRADEQLLETIVQRLGELFARVLLGERQVGRQPAQLSRPVFQFDRALLKGDRRPLAFSDVRDEGDGVSAPGVGQMIQTDFERKRRPVLPLTDELGVHTRRLGARFGEVPGPMLRVRVTNGRRHEPRDRPANQLPGRPAEHRFEGAIRRRDRSLGIHHDNALRGGLQQQLHFPIALFVAARSKRLLVLPQRRFGAGALDRVPGSFGDVADQRDLRRRPRTWCRVVGTEGGHQLPAFQHHHADKRRDLSRPHGDALGVRKSWIRIDVVHHHRLAAPEGIAQRRRKAPQRTLSGKGCNVASVFTPNDVLAVFELSVPDTVYAQVFPQKLRGDFLHVERIAQRPQRIGKPEEECLSLVVSQQAFAQHLHMRFAGPALGDIGRDAREPYGSPVVRGSIEKRLACACDPPHLARIRATDAELFGKGTRSTRIESRRNGAFDTTPILGMTEVQCPGQRRQSSLGNSQEQADFRRPESLLRDHVVVEHADTSAPGRELEALLARTQRLLCVSGVNERPDEADDAPLGIVLRR